LTHHHQPLAVIPLRQRQVRSFDQDPTGTVAISHLGVNPESQRQQLAPLGKTPLVAEKVSQQVSHTRQQQTCLGTALAPVDGSVHRMVGAAELIADAVSVSKLRPRKSTEVRDRLAAKVAHPEAIRGEARELGKTEHGLRVLEPQGTAGLQERLEPRQTME
jgi:hypothetical protein